jgi:hypothetical protein
MQHSRIGAEPPDRESPAEHGNAVLAGRLLLGEGDPSKRGVRAKSAEQAR